MRGREHCRHKAHFSGAPDDGDDSVDEEFFDDEDEESKAETSFLAVQEQEVLWLRARDTAKSGPSYAHYFEWDYTMGLGSWSDQYDPAEHRRWSDDYFDEPSFDPGRAVTPPTSAAAMPSTPTPQRIRHAKLLETLASTPSRAITPATPASPPPPALVVPTSQPEQDYGFLSDYPITLAQCIKWGKQNAKQEVAKMTPEQLDSFNEIITHCSDMINEDKARKQRAFLMAKTAGEEQERKEKERCAEVAREQERLVEEKRLAEEAERKTRFEDRKALAKAERARLEKEAEGMDVTIGEIPEPPSNPADNPFAGVEEITTDAAAATDEAEEETSLENLEAMYDELIASGHGIGNEDAKLPLTKAVRPLSTNTNRNPILLAPPKPEPKRKEAQGSRKQSDKNDQTKVSVNDSLRAFELATNIAEQMKMSVKDTLPHAMTIIASQTSSGTPRGGSAANQGRGVVSGGRNGGEGSTTIRGSGRNPSAPTPKSSYASVASGDGVAWQVAGKKQTCTARGTNRNEVVFRLPPEAQTTFQVGTRPEGLELETGVFDTIDAIPAFATTFQGTDSPNRLVSVCWNTRSTLVVKCANHVTITQRAIVGWGIGDYVHVEDSEAQIVNRPTTSSLKFVGIPARDDYGDPYLEDHILKDLKAHPKWASATFVGRPKWIKAKAQSSLGPNGTILVEVED
ncbi:hypothetical protein APHAL10511_000240, partial [Amanita phalloides]